MVIAFVPVFMLVVTAMPAVIVAIAMAVVIIDHSNAVSAGGDRRARGGAYGAADDGGFTPARRRADRGARRAAQSATDHGVAIQAVFGMRRGDQNRCQNQS